MRTGIVQEKEAAKPVEKGSGPRRTRRGSSFMETAERAAKREEKTERGGGPGDADAVRQRARERRERFERMQERRRQREELLRRQEERRSRRKRLEAEYEKSRLLRRLRLKAYTEKQILKRIDDRERMEERNAKIVQARATHGRLPVSREARPPKVISVRLSHPLVRVKLF